MRASASPREGGQGGWAGARAGRFDPPQDAPLAIFTDLPHIPCMNRREFTRSLAAIGLTPALPSLPSQAMAAPAPAFTPYMYGLGAHMARSTGLCSVEMLSQKLALPPAAAGAMQAKLIRSGVITAPNAAGLAMATDPYMATIRFKTATTALGKATRRYAPSITDTGHASPTEDAQPSPDAVSAPTPASPPDRTHQAPRQKT